MILRYKATKERINIGDKVTTFRGQIGTVTGFIPPHKPSSSGRVNVKLDGEKYYTDSFFPSVIEAEIVDETEAK